MSDLRLNLDTIAFSELIELGRSMIPTVAPGWTDHNVHDPGIMLKELAAWVADAQIYALGRISRGEREAYGRLLGLELAGPRPARGLIWPLAADAAPGTRPPWVAGTVVDRTARVTGDRPQAPSFFPMHRVELTTAALTQLTSIADGITRDWTRANSEQGATFLPFGTAPRAGDALVLTLAGTLIATPAANAPIAIGFEVVADSTQRRSEADQNEQTGPGCAPMRLRATLRDDLGSWEVPIVTDTTAGLSHSGVLLLTLDPALAGVSGTFTLSMEVVGGLLRPPQVRRIALNVLPVEQIEEVFEEQPQFGTGLPDQTYTLRRTGLMYPLDDSFTVSLSNGGSLMRAWKPTSDLSVANPDDETYAVDTAKGIVTFGNGINGRAPSPGSALQATYRVSAGVDGNLPRGVKWSIAGVPAPFGVNSEATAGGAAARDLAALRGIARQRILQARPIVTARDLQDAALALDDLDVRRAHDLPPTSGARRLGVARVLVAVGPHDLQPGAAIDESAVWLSEIRRRLAPRLPLGQSLDVIGPRLVDVRISVRLVAEPRLNPDDVRCDVETELRKRLAMSVRDDSPVWPFGRDLTALMVKGWLRRVPGVARVVSVALQSAARNDSLLSLGPISLPQLLVEPGDIVVDRSPAGGSA